MKYICKTNEPEVLANFKAQANQDWQPTYELFRGKDKQQFHHHLIAEQGHICCYCGGRIVHADSHIEHFKPQTEFAELELDYFNLLASCQNKLEPKEPRHCGMGKGDWFDDRLLVSPTIADCEDFFEYTIDGQILPSRESEKAAAAATATIENLRLNIRKLQASRSGAIYSIYGDPDLELPLSPDEIDKLVHYYSQTTDGQYQPYCQTIVYILNQEKIDRR